MLSQACKAAIKAVVYLASKHDTGERAMIKEISGKINENEHTVGKVLQTLVKQGIINSVKGPSGGFFISKPQMKEPIITIVEAIDGINIFKECGLGLSKCSESHPCPIHHEYKTARNLIEKLFTDNKISSFH
ncbi:MAG: Rrf2 family transcriptional regulator [Bacteroidetes bacterium]|nr:Rrf2 family transcriptional regulator [Bacteroidota bacterium]